MRRWKVWLLTGGLLLALVVGFVSLVNFVLFPAIERKIEDAPRVQAFAIADAVNTYFVIHGKYPDRLEDLTKPDLDGNKALLCPEAILDPWGKPYQADFPADEKGKVRIWTVSPAGETISNAKKH